jgi:hypothetical protein
VEDAAYLGGRNFCRRANLIHSFDETRRRIFRSRAHFEQVNTTARLVERNEVREGSADIDCQTPSHRFS